MSLDRELARDSIGAQAYGIAGNTIEEARRLYRGQFTAEAAAAKVADPAAKKSIASYIKTGLQNPATQQMILAGVSGLAGVVASAATGGLGGKAGASAAGAITGALLGIVGSKLRGENWGPAFKAALKGAAAGAAGGFLGAAAGQLASGAIGAATAGPQQTTPVTDADLADPTVNNALPVTDADLADPTVDNAYPNQPAVDAETSAQNAARAKAYGTDGDVSTADIDRKSVV